MFLVVKLKGEDFFVCMWVVVCNKHNKKRMKMCNVNVFWDFPVFFTIACHEGKYKRKMGILD